MCTRGSILHGVASDHSDGYGKEFGWEIAFLLGVFSICRDTHLLLTQFINEHNHHSFSTVISLFSHSYLNHLPNPPIPPNNQPQLPPLLPTEQPIPQLLRKKL